DPSHVASRIRQAQDLDPDVLVIEDLRGAPAADAALDAALSGVLVVGSMHATDLRNAIDRLLAFGLSRPMLADGLFGLSHQKLDDASGASGPALAWSCLRMTASHRDALRSDRDAFDGLLTESVASRPTEARRTRPAA
ncbi:MAG: Flp pilus assembly complex ATPase component TadA, partial [Phycisphaerales bacterium]|nr:Flp pilus assembly complex ATPase component TadA [Phycisphaerales bacterium]